jgi:AraC family transcriptional regulator
VIVVHKLPETQRLNLKDAIPAHSDHYLFTETISGSFEYPEHFTGLGIIAMLRGNGDFKINDVNTRLDENGFFVVNRGSKLSIRLHGDANIPVLLYFNTILSEVLTNTIFYRNKVSGTEAMHGFHDFSLLEHIHYKNATLKNHLPWLIDLGASCASFHALKADMLIRVLLDDIIAENYSAMAVSNNLAVVKRATRIALYKRLSLAKQWMELNYASSFTMDQVADVAMQNTHHFLRLFKKAFDITPHQYLIDIRIAQAKNRLTETDQSVSAICHAVGFDSLSSFSTLFKERSGLSPTGFRQQKRI